MEFRVLGPVVGHENGRRLKLGGPKQRLVLAMLLTARGDSVSTGVLIDGVWEDAPPPTARKTLQGYVHHLRSEIGEALATDSAGYSLRLDDAQVDERRFCTVVDQSRDLMADDPAGVSERLAEALGLWRGNPYADLDGELVLLPEITRLEEVRMVALGDRIDADLALGRHELLIGELESLTADHPLRERFRAQHMLALYRSGRHGEALRAFARTRRHLIEEMGIEPSEQLTALEERMLARDPSLDPMIEPRAGSARAVRGYELREVAFADASGEMVYRGYQRSIGREVAIRVLGAEQANDPAFMARYQADTARVAQVDHPNVVSVQDTWREPDRVYQVMPWIEGRRLDAYVADGRPPTSVALKLLQQLADALTAAHRHGVVHGALDAHAVLVSGAGDAYLVDFVVGRPTGPVDEDFTGFARVAHLLLTGFERSVDAGRYEPSLVGTAAPELGELFAATFDRAPPRPAELMRAVRRLFGADVVELADERRAERTDLRNPFKGLRAFQIADARDFFGRDAVVDRLVDTLAQRRLVAVVGPSGSGKSSVVKAGLAARLETGDHPVLVTEMYPGAYPFDELEGALRRVAVTERRMGDDLLADERGLTRVLTSILPDDDSEVVLVIDQFEELFSMVDSEAVRALFLGSLVAAAREPRSRLRVVITMRADFFDRPLRYPDFGELLEAGLVPLTMPDRAGLAAAIEGPAAAVGVSIEPGLTAEMVRDVIEQPGGLPLLQYAVTELFERRASDVLTLEAYRAAGGVRGAVAARAESLFVELGPEGGAAMHQAFLRLVTVDEGADYVRRRVSRAELQALEVDRRVLNEGLQRFGAHRLLTFDFDPVSRAPTVEVAHEALLREWDRLRGWVVDQRDHLVSRRRLGAAIREWHEAGDDPSYLLGGARLAQFDAWAATTDLALSNEERSFLEASRSHSTALAHRAATRRRRVMVALLVAAAVASAFGVYALVQRNEVSEQAYEAETARLGNQAGFVSEWNHQLALLMAVETYRRDPGFEGLNALQRVLVDTRSFLGVIGATHDYRDVRWVGDDRLIASTSTSIQLLDVATAEVTNLPIDAGSESGTAGVGASSPAGIAAVADVDGELWLVDATSGGVVAGPGARGSTAVALSDDGSLLAAGFGDGRVEVFDVASGSRLASAVVNPPRSLDDVDLAQGVLVDDRAGYELEGVSHLAFDAAGERLVSAGGVFVRVWDATDLAALGPEIVHASGFDDLNQFVRAPIDVWFDEADPDIVVVAGPTFVVRWRTTGERASIAPAALGSDATGSITASAQTGDGGALVLTSSGRVRRLTADDLRGGRADPPDAGSLVFETQQTQTTALAVDPSGSRFAVASDGGVVLGALDGRRLLAHAYPIGLSTTPSITSDGQTLAAGLATDGLSDLSTTPPSRVSFDVNVEIAEVAGSAATISFVAADDRNILVWRSDFVTMANAYDYDSGEYIASVWGSFAPAWSDDGSLVVRVSPTGGTRIEDLRSSSVISAGPLAARAADFDSTAARVVVSFVEQLPPAFEPTPTTGLLIDLASGTELGLPAMPGGVFSAAFTPDDEQIVVVGGEGGVWMLDARTLELVRELQDADLATAMAAPPPTFTTDGRWMFSGSDAQARVWHVESGLQLGKTFPSQAGGIPYGVADGTLLRLVTALDGKALLWNLDDASWTELACRAAGRNMTRAEWAVYGPADTDYRATCPQYALEGKAP